MSHPLMQVLAGRWLALVGLIAIVILSVALAATSLTAARTEAALRARIAAMTAENRQAGAVWGAKLAACEAGGGPARGRVTAATLSDEARARELASNAPAGFDGCARMESADQAVMETLKK